MPSPVPGAGFLKISHPKKRAVLIAYTSTVHVGKACAAAHITMRMHHYWLKVDPDYAAAFEEAKLMAAQTLEDEASRRAFVGSDLLLIFLLKGALPEKYREHVKVETDVTVRLETALGQGMKRLEVLRGPRNAA